MIITDTISISSKGQTDFVDITPEIEKQVAKSRLDSGIVTVFVTGSTAGLAVIENEPGLIADYKEMWQRLAPDNIRYAHDSAWGDGKGHSHVRASLLGPSLVIPFKDKKLLLGTWQQVVLADFDNRPRSRQIVIQLMGE